MNVKCSENKATQSAYKGVNNGGETELCTFTAGENAEANTCLTNEVSISGLCNTNTNKESEENCKPVKYDVSLVLCAYTSSVKASCKHILRITFSGTSTIKLKSVKGKNVVIPIEAADEDNNKN